MCQLKTTLFENATHVPLIISAPGMSRGAVAETMSEMVDFYPTLTQLAGLEMPNPYRPPNDLAESADSDTGSPDQAKRFFFFLFGIVLYILIVATASMFLSERLGIIMASASPVVAIALLIWVSRD